MLCLSSHLLIAKARGLVGRGLVSDERREPAGFAGEACLVPDSSDLRPPWDLSFVQHCGYWAHRDAQTGESSWPIPAGLTREGLADFGEEHGILYATPDVGDIFLQYGRSRRTFVHVGIVMSVLGTGQFCPKTPYFDVYTVEGDTGANGRLHGGLTLRVRRRLNPGAGDRFLSWMELEPYARQLAASLPRSAASLLKSA